MTHSASTPQAGSIELSSSLGRRLIATTVAGSAVAMLTATVVNVALPSLADDLGASSSEQQWVINAYLLTIASLILVGGSLGDRFGRLRVYRIGVAWFALASVGCAVAPNVEFLILMRLLQGVGGALLTPGSLSIIKATFVKDDRGRAVGQWSGLSGIAAAVGPLVGGLLVDFSWRWVFLVNIPVAAAVLWLSTGLPESQHAEAREVSLDWLGATLAVLTLGGASYALIQGPGGGWQSFEVFLGVGSMAALVVLVIYERRHRHPMVPIDLFATRDFTAANLITLLVYGGMGVVFFLLSIQLQVSAGFTPLQAGAALLPVTGLMLLLSSRAGELAQRFGPRWPLTIGPILIAGGMLLLSGIDSDTDYVTDVLPGVTVFGLGLAASVAPVTATALGSVPDQRSGAASGTNNAVSRTGQLLTVAAIPPIVGLTGDALSSQQALDAGFPDAMIIGGALVAAGSIVAVSLLRSETVEEDEDENRDQKRHHVQCAVDSPHPSPTQR